MTAHRALNPCDNGITSDQNWPKQMLFHNVEMENIVQEIAIRINTYNRLLAVAREAIAGA